MMRRIVAFGNANDNACPRWRPIVYEINVELLAVRRVPFNPANTLSLFRSMLDREGYYRVRIPARHRHARG